MPRSAGVGSSVVAADVLWSDPVAAPGLCANHARGVGLTFGPDVTQVSGHPDSHALCSCCAQCPVPSCLIASSADAQSSTHQMDRRGMSATVHDMFRAGFVARTAQDTSDYGQQQL